MHDIERVTALRECVGHDPPVLDRDDARAVLDELAQHGLGSRLRRARRDEPCTAVPGRADDLGRRLRLAEVRVVFLVGWHAHDLGIAAQAACHVRRHRGRDVFHIRASCVHRGAPEIDHFETRCEAGADLALTGTERGFLVRRLAPYCCLRAVDCWPVYGYAGVTEGLLLRCPDSIRLWGYLWGGGCQHRCQGRWGRWAPLLLASVGVE